MERMLIHSLKQIVQIVDDDTLILVGNSMKEIKTLSSESNNLSIVVDRNGKVEAIGNNDEINERYKKGGFETTIDGSGNTLIPGLVDGHTHPVWCGDRVNEFAMKLAGATYMDVHKAGGGINYTVNCVRDATEDALYRDFKMYATKMMLSGTTLAECKSGYGLNAETEIKMLKVINRGIKDQSLPIDLSVTFCGAHSIPKGSTAEEATVDVISNQIPQIESLMQTGEFQVDNIDVFCEKGVFDVDQTRRMLEAGVKAGMAINFHGEELHRLHSAEMGAELKARAISHLEEISDEGITALANSGSIGVVLPTTAYVLRLQPPPVRKMIEGGMAVALGSDFNPNAHCLAMPIVMHMACVVLHMSMNEALVAATLNAAASLGRSHLQGSIQVGKLGDFVLIDAPRWEHLIYQLGSYHHLITHVIKEGKVVYEKPK